MTQMEIEAEFASLRGQISAFRQRQETREAGWRKLRKAASALSIIYAIAGVGLSLAGLLLHPAPDADQFTRGGIIFLPDYRQYSP